MKRLITKISLLAVVAIGLLTGCDYRPLEDIEPQHQTALIPVRIDWSVSGVPVASMHRASVLLFPEGGGPVLEYYLETDLYYRTIEVPVGVYSVVVMNETISGSDWNSITFTGTDRYETLAAVGNPDNNGSRGMYVYSEQLPLIINPEPLAAWSLDRFEVTSEMVKSTRASGNLAADVPDLTVAKPLPRIEQITITARVTNLASSMQVTGTLNGMASGVYMVSGERIPVPAAHAFILNGRVYDPNEKDGTTTRTFNIFGKLPVSTARYEMNLDFLLNDGTPHPTETFDVTTMFGRDESVVPPLNRLQVGYSDISPDHPIVLPSMAVGSGVTVDDWDEVIIPL